MSIILTLGNVEIAESEFIGRHPDTLSTCLAAELVYSIAAQVHVQNSGFLRDFTKGKLLNPTALQLEDVDATVIESYGLEDLRADVNVQISALNSKNITPIPIRVNLVGQITAPQFNQTNLDQIVREDTFDVFDRAGYFLHGDFVPEHVIVDTQGVTSQSSNLNRTTQHNKFADSCVVYGHYIREPFGIDGTFPSLVIAKKIDRTLEETVRQGIIPELRSDGKVHVSVVRESNGYRIREILNMKVNLVTYGKFNDVINFHEPTKPWKSYNPQLVEAFAQALRNK